ncbi:hypothetical protein LzC2_16790 [Planctomycetes bacterium LzC2]|uniref:Uncharacterized protein n=1 Tax=Alienimonas chondri TaxID=2681879 RepID=A0ABX1VE95_9PLAN|nr:hypothetical protein [Alienimonas chondri]
MGRIIASKRTPSVELADRIRKLAIEWQVWPTNEETAVNRARIDYYTRIGMDGRRINTMSIGPK